MTYRLWLALGFVAAVAFTPGPACARELVDGAAGALASSAVPSVETSHEAPAADPRASERLPLVNATPRQTGLQRGARQVSATFARCPGGASWSDLLHCRRTGGVRVLEFATPPPRR